MLVRMLWDRRGLRWTMRFLGTMLRGVHSKGNGMRTVWVALCFSLFAAGAWARGPVAVRAYTKADGTYVPAHTRALPGTASNSPYSRATAGPGTQSAYVRSEGGDSSGGAAIEDNTNWSAGLGGPKARPDQKAPACVYSDVMTDEQIAACRKH